ncbi:hypothetical protein [Rhodanobacter sp. L36]|uniref:hypothetical protein n=1 Tax=Rhodanobacter sp. L36 TaxID=1747221 RepID=UPI0020B10F77|nr:hypothetical protein [Rhodanobacter sp. L36]
MSRLRRALLLVAFAGIVTIIQAGDIHAAATQTAKPPSTLLPAVNVAGTDARWQLIELHRNGAIGRDVAVTFGLPFAPGLLKDARNVRILDEQNRELPAHVEPTLRWYFKDNSIRAVKVQLHADLDGDTRKLHFTYDVPATTPLSDGWDYADGEVQDSNDVTVPGVLATLTAQWMSASLIAGPQQPTSSSPYDRYFATQFAWAKALPSKQGSSWLFDRPTALFQQYVRTGRLDYLAAATESYAFYMSHLRHFGMPGWPLCGGGWSLGEVNVCDPKYVYIEPILFALGLNGDDSRHDASLVERMMGSWRSGGWNYPAGPYDKPEHRFTEREMGLGLLETVSAYEVTGDADYRKDINDRVGWLYDHQQHNPDGLGNDGSWRSSWQAHEGDKYDAATDVRGTSPWMTENIVDGLWHAWLVTGDKRIPVMLTGFGRYLERYGWIDIDTLKPGADWRDSCSGASGQISWYWSSPHGDPARVLAIQNSDGWYSDYHNVELTLPVALARYFETDPAQQRALDKRMALLGSSYNMTCATTSATPRRFNWNNRGVGVVQWLIHHSATQP